MPSTDIALSAIAAANICLQSGKTLLKAYQDFRDANAQVGDKIVLVKAIWSRTTIQIEFVKRVANSLGEEHCRIHLEVFEMLQSKLRMANTKIESVLGKGSNSGVNRWKFIFVREAMDETISQLEKWQRVFDPTWYLILRIGDEIIDTELSTPSRLSRDVNLGSPGTETPDDDFTLVPAQRFRGTLGIKKGNEASGKIHITLPEDGLAWENATQVKYSGTRLIPRAAPKKARMYAVDTIVCDQTIDISRVRADAESLAKKLARIDPGTFGLLSCSGLVKRKDPETGQLASINLIFSMKEEMPKPVALRNHLLHSSGFSLTTVLSVARQLASAVSYVHTCGFVHKNIRPETVLVFPEENDMAPFVLGSAYLLGFDSFRSVNFQTLRSGDEAWDRNLYRHPSRQGLFAHNDYIMQHDVYSLGVCLLELGLWESLVRYQEDGGSDAEDDNKLPLDSLGLSLQDFEFQGREAAEPSSKIKDHLVELARSRLPSRMGDKYTSIVVTCLTCLDEGNEDFGDEEEMRDEDGILVGVRFIEKILFKMNEIVL
ncbi:hypothetical protein PT974_12351 [Cladobotryum mycophilum]|uniref:Protein kinase domain-containing protein n=1 Tax=Cladobotryum mycophilum TaxID=491253 RepID=A0ABR0S7S0_9HYPO